jgi:hypothetical protein
VKIPRWMINVLLALSLGTLIIAAVWWWMSWPAWTMREFVRLANEGRLDKTGPLMQW